MEYSRKKRIKISLTLNLYSYRTLHSYNLIWAVCHLFLRQRWWTLTYSVSGNHWPGEPRDQLKTTSARKFRPAFGATSKTRIFYKYVVFKHSLSLLHNFFAAATHSLQCDSTDRQIATTWMDLADIHFFNISLTMRLFSVSEKPTVSNHKNKDILNM